ncbi:MAG: formate dehydrogenase accessory protein FdhE [Hyphomicrobiaceae bacterium]
MGWAKAPNTLLCTCSLCATMWNVVRVKCLLCGSTDGIAYQMIDGKPDTVRAEKCRSHVKILLSGQRSQAWCFAGVATLWLDMLIAKRGWKRVGQNVFPLRH